MNTITFVIFSLASWRIANLFVWESGPFHIFIKIRERTGIIHDKNGEPYQYPNSFFANLLSCVWCSSVWVGFGWFLFWLLLPEIAAMCAIPFAFSTGAIVVDKIVKG